MMYCRKTRNCVPVHAIVSRNTQLCVFRRSKIVSSDSQYYFFYIYAIACLPTKQNVVPGQRNLVPGSSYIENAKSCPRNYLYRSKTQNVVPGQRKIMSPEVALYKLHRRRKILSPEGAIYKLHRRRKMLFPDNAK